MHKICKIRHSLIRTCRQKRDHICSWTLPVFTYSCNSRSLDRSKNFISMRIYRELVYKKTDTWKCKGQKYCHL